MKKRSRNYLISSERTLYLFANFVREMGAGQRLADFRASCHLAQGAYNELELAQVAAACLAVEGVRAQGEALESSVRSRSSESDARRVMPSQGKLRRCQQSLRRLTSSTYLSRTGWTASSAG